MTYTHRMSWAVQALEQLRSFLAPLYAWRKPNGQDKYDKNDYRTRPAIVQFCVTYVQHQLKRTPAQTVEFRARIPGTAATDARATTTTAGVGGWHYPTGQCEDKWDVAWFMIPFTQKSHPWACDKENTPERNTSGLELLGDVYLKNTTRNFTPDMPALTPQLQAPTTRATHTSSANTSPAPFPTCA